MIIDQTNIANYLPAKNR